MKLFHTGVACALLIVAVTSSGCGTINGIRAKNQLNEGARAYKSGKFAEAQEHFQRAAELDPTQTNALFFRARSLHSQYRPGVEGEQNKDKAREAIAAYQKVLETNPQNDEAYIAVASLYRAINEDDKERDWITTRANLDSMPKEKRAEAYAVLASKQWNCAFTITEQKQNQKNVTKPDGKVIIQYMKPKDQKEFEQAQQCTTEGLRLADQAISLDPNSEVAWSYKTNLLNQVGRLAEMEGNAERKSEYDKKAQVAQQRTNELNEINKQRKKEEEARKAPAQSTS